MMRGAADSSPLRVILDELAGLRKLIERLLGENHPGARPERSLTIDQCGMKELVPMMPPGYRSAASVCRLIKAGVITEGAKRFGHRWVFNPAVVRKELEIHRLKRAGLLK